MQAAGLRNLSCPWSCSRKSWEKHQWWLPLLLGASKLRLFALGIWLTCVAAMYMPSYVPVYLDADFGLQTSSLAWPWTCPFPVALTGDLAYYADSEHPHWSCPARLFQILSDRTLDSEVPALAALVRLMAYLCFWSSQTSLLSDSKIRGSKWMQS